MAGASGAHGRRRTPRCGAADRGEGELDGGREQTRVVPTSVAYVNLKQAEISKYTRNLAPANRAILLSGPAELYQQMLAKALAHYFEAKILLLDPIDFLINFMANTAPVAASSLFSQSYAEDPQPL
ncbi:hypothetical protein ZWY2020_003244 [Hordeum vulgare]|nr:hypothetical protein ZWY2020_003244 [Hordeum vulgare]